MITIIFCLMPFFRDNYGYVSWTHWSTCTLNISCFSVWGGISSVKKLCYFHQEEKDFGRRRYFLNRTRLGICIILLVCFPISKKLSTTWVGGACPKCYSWVLTSRASPQKTFLHLKKDFLSSPLLCPLAVSQQSRWATGKWFDIFFSSSKKNHLQLPGKQLLWLRNTYVL